MLFLSDRTEDEQIVRLFLIFLIPAAWRGHVPAGRRSVSYRCSGVSSETCLCRHGSLFVFHGTSSVF